MEPKKIKIFKCFCISILFLVNIFLFAACAEKKGTADNERFYIPDNEISEKYDKSIYINKLINTGENIVIVGTPDKIVINKFIDVYNITSDEIFSVDPEMLKQLSSEYFQFSFRIAEHYLIINTSNYDSNKLIIADISNYGIISQTDLEYGECLSDCFINKSGNIEIILCKGNQYGISVSSKIFDTDSCIINNKSDYGFHKSQYTRVYYDLKSEEVYILDSFADESGEHVNVSFSRYSSNGEKVFSSDIFTYELSVFKKCMINACGNICCVYYNNDSSVYVDEYNNTDGMLVSSCEMEISSDYNIVSLSSEIYDCLCSDDSYLYGYKAEDNSMLKLIPLASDLDSIDYYESAGMLIIDSEVQLIKEEKTVIKLDNEGRTADNITIEASSENMEIKDINIIKDNICILENNKEDNSFCIRRSDWWNNSSVLIEGEIDASPEQLITDKKNNIYLISFDEDNYVLNIDIYSFEGEKFSSSICKDCYAFFDSVCANDDGIIISYLNIEGKLVFSKLKESEETVSELFKTDFSFVNTIRMCEGIDKYDFLYYSNEGLCGFFNGKTENLTTWSRSDLYLKFNEICIMNNQDILALVNDYNNNKEMCYLSLADEKTAKKFKNKKEIVVGGYEILTSDILNTVKQYNSKNSNYHIIVKDYSNEVYFGEYRDELAFLKNPPDIMLGDSEHIFLGEDYYLDLTEYLNKDLNKNDYFDNILRIYQNKSGIYTVPVSFDVKGIECIDERDGAEYNDIKSFSSMYNSLDYSIFNNDKITDILIYKNSSSFIDWFNCKCDFNNEDFISLLNLIKENYNKSDNKAYYFESLSLCDLKKSVEFEYNYGHEPQFNGIPGRTSCENIMSSDLNVSILSNTKYKSEAWEFVKVLFEEDYQNSLKKGYPILKKSFERKIISERSELFDLYGGTVLNSFGEEVVFKTMSEDYFDTVILKKLEKVSRFDICDSRISEIFDEELKKFLEGDQSAEKTADIIQNKVSLCLDEKS